LELAFSEKNLRQLCESEKAAALAFGPLVAAQLKRRLSDMRSADHVAELIAGNPRNGQLNGEEVIHVDLGEEVVLTLCANHGLPPLSDTGKMDWQRVNRVKILEIRALNE
jgi:hypothetical protein